MLPQENGWPQITLWYAPDEVNLQKLATYCEDNSTNGETNFFKMDHKIHDLLPTWKHQHGVTNVWQEPAVRGSERLKVGGKIAHPNQKPLNLMKRCIETSSHLGDNIWEPFGGLCTASVAAMMTGRRYFSAEINETFYKIAKSRLEELVLI